MNTDPIYEADGKISVRKAVPFGLQHVLAMFVANIAPILIVTGVVKIPASEAGAIVQAAMIIAGIGSLLQMYPVFRLGSGLPVIMGISFTFVSVFCVIGLKYGYGAILGAVLVGGVLEGILGLGATWWRKLVPPIVSATVVTAIGFSLLPIGANSFGGGFGHPEFGDARRSFRRHHELGHHHQRVVVIHYPVYEQHADTHRIHLHGSHPRQLRERFRVRHHSHGDIHPVAAPFL